MAIKSNTRIPKIRILGNFEDLAELTYNAPGVYVEDKPESGELADTLLIKRTNHPSFKIQKVNRLVLMWHELAHSTMHPNRLNRSLERAEEEIVAQTACNELLKEIGRHTQKIQKWTDKYVAGYQKVAKMDLTELQPYVDAAVKYMKENYVGAEEIELLYD